MSFAGQEEQGFLEQSRLAEQSSDWQDLYQARAGIEGTISQSVRGYGLRVRLNFQAASVQSNMN